MAYSNRWIFLRAVLGTVLVVLLGSCGNNLISDSDTGDCKSYLSARDYDNALTTCTSYKNKASAYMGKAGYDYINLLDNSGSTPTAGTDNESFGADDLTPDNAGAKFLKILKLTYDDISDNNTRKTSIQSALTNLDSAISQLKPVYSTDADAATNYAIANLFALKLDESVKLDSDGAASCADTIDNDSDQSASGSEFVCTATAASPNGDSPGSTNPAFRTNDGFLQKAEKRKAFDTAKTNGNICSPFTNTTTYLSQASDGFSKGSFGSSDVSSLLETAGKATCLVIQCLNAYDSNCSIPTQCASGGKFYSSDSC